MVEIQPWVAILSALLTPVIAVLAAYIAFQQWGVARNKFKFDLFQKRLAIYQAANMAISLILINGKIDPMEDLHFRREVSDAGWLLDDDIDTYLNNEFSRKLSALRNKRAVLDNLAPESPERSAMSAEYVQAMQWFADQKPVLKEKFSPYLRIQH
jgi:hypothetical protein